MESQIEIASRLEFLNLYNKEGLYEHQEFVRRYLSPFTPYKGLLLFHSLGSGKSLACISLAVDHYEISGIKCLVVTKGESGSDNFKSQIAMYRTMHKPDFVPSDIFEMDHYISLNNKVYMMQDLDVKEHFSNRIIIFDEIHNIRDLKNSKMPVYASLTKILKYAKNIKVVLATATPMTDDVDQLKSAVKLLNVMRPDKDSNDYSGIISYNSKIRQRPRSCIKVNPDLQTEFEGFMSMMTGHQAIFYELEQQKGTPDDIYRTLTHISLFCFDDGSVGKIINETKFIKIKKKATFISVKSGQPRELRYTHHRIKDEFRNHLKGEKLRHSSCKYAAFVEILQTYTQCPLTFVFVEEVHGSGLLLLANILEEHGYSLYLGEKLETISPGKRYTFCVGSAETCPNPAERLEGFNSELNARGSYVQILLGSRIISESITLLGIRQFHSMTPHWNDSTVEQAIGRVIRSGSHSRLTPPEQVVDIYVHAAMHPEVISVDSIKLKMSMEKQARIKAMEKLLQENAVDRYVLQERFEGGELDATHFVVYYIGRYKDVMAEKLSEVLDPRATYKVSELIEILDWHPLVIMEFLYIAITENLEIFPTSHTACEGSNPKRSEGFPSNPKGRTGLYMRENRGSIFFIDDPAAPFEFIYTPPKRKTKRYLIENPTVAINENFEMRSSTITEKIRHFEVCVEQDRWDLLTFFSKMYIRESEGVYHIMQYKETEEAYTAMIPVPKKPAGKTRMFDPETKTWSNMKLSDEMEILEKFRHEYEILMQKIDTKGIFGIISIIDNNMRLRTRMFEDLTLAENDKRFVRKGRNLASMKKEQLSEIAKELGITHTTVTVRTKDLIKDIENFMIKTSRFIFL
jgi:hypothetical protein